MSDHSSRRRLLLPLTLACALAAGAFSCGVPDDQPPTVVVTTNILGDVVREVVGQEAEVTVLMEANADPHSFGISAPQAAQIEQADLVVYNGLGLEENVLRHVDSARAAGVSTLGVGEAVDPLRYTSDDMKGQPDPHFWTDPDRVSKATRLIAKSVRTEVDGVDEQAVTDNAARYEAELDKLTSWMERSFSRVPEEQRKLVTNHHVFGYLAARFDFQVIGAVIPSGTTLASPSAADLESLTTAVERAGVRAIFADSSQPDRLAKALKQESGTEVEVVPLHSESLTEKGQGAGTYLEMTRSNTRAITEGLTD